MNDGFAPASVGSPAGGRRAPSPGCARRRRAPACGAARSCCSSASRTFSKRGSQRRWRSRFESGAWRSQSASRPSAHGEERIERQPGRRQRAAEERQVVRVREGELQVRPLLEDGRRDGRPATSPRAEATLGADCGAFAGFAAGFVAGALAAGARVAPVSGGFGCSLVDIPSHSTRSAAHSALRIPYSEFTPDSARRTPDSVHARSVEEIEQLLLDRPELPEDFSEMSRGPKNGTSTRWRIRAGRGDST